MSMPSSTPYAFTAASSSLIGSRAAYISGGTCVLQKDTIRLNAA